MKKVNTKKVILLTSLTYVIVFFGTFLISQLCHSSWCRVRDDDPLGMILFAFLPLLPLFILSLITYKMRDEVFRAWWYFACWWVPIIIVVTIMLNNASGTGGGYIGMGQDFIFLIHGILYAVLVIVSLVKIVRAYTHSKK